MNKILIILIYSLTLTSNLKANDSSALYQKRVQTIKVFSKWLSKNTKSEIESTGTYYPAYSTSIFQFKTFESALNIFFNIVKIDSIISNAEKAEVRLGPSIKTQVVRGLISRFNELSHIVEADSLKFKPYTKGDIHILIDEEIDYDNSIIQYFIIKGEEIPYLLFTFEFESTTLAWIDVSQQEVNKHQKLIKYFQGLPKKE